MKHLRKVLTFRVAMMLLACGDASGYECTNEQGKDCLGHTDGKSQLDG